MRYPAGRGGPAITNRLDRIILIAFETPEKDDVRITVKILVWVGEMEAIEHLQSVIAGIRMR